jgi:hypothetical protein
MTVETTQKGRRHTMGGGKGGATTQMAPMTTNGATMTFTVSDRDLVQQ